MQTSMGTKVKKRPLFSIITPVRNRAWKIRRCILSVYFQLPSREHIIIEDGTDIDNTYEAIEQLSYPGMIILRNKIRQERVRSQQKGFDIAQGEWILSLGSDDILLHRALTHWQKHIYNNPEAQCLHSGWKTFKKNGSVVNRNVYEIQENQSITPGMVAMGSFIFKRELLDKVRFPDVINYNQFSEQANIPEYKGKIFGNPWGDDFYLFYHINKITKSIPIKDHLIGIFEREHTDYEQTFI